MSYGQIGASAVLSAIGLLIIVACIGGIIYLTKEIIKFIKA